MVLILYSDIDFFSPRKIHPSELTEINLCAAVINYLLIICLQCLFQQVIFIWYTFFFFFLINCSTSSTVFKGYRLVGKLKKIPFRDTRRMDIKPFQILSVLSTPLQNAIWYLPATMTQNSLHRNGTGGCLQEQPIQPCLVL